MIKENRIIGNSTMFKIFINNLKTKSLLTIKDLEKKRSEALIITSDIRKNISILIIDDKGFDSEPLKSIGYLDINKVFEHKNIDDYARFDIIFCDINGIATNLDGTYQGAALAKQIKERYPNKIVIIYSASPQKLSMTEIGKCVDDIIEKDISPSKMSEKIDNYIRSLKDPVLFWKRTKTELIKNDIETKNVSLIEHYYVKSILKNKDYTSKMYDVVSYIKEFPAMTFLMKSLAIIIKTNIGG